MHQNSKWKFALAAAFILASAPLRAQSDAGPQAEPEMLEKYVVTGSNIQDAADALAVPIAVVTPDQIENSGAETNVLDVLRKISPAITGIGGENATISSAATYGGSIVSIHNLPTLVLIDGRRMAYDPSDATGGLEFVDLNMIPTAAIQDIQILSDGASAIYGGDAVGGVINVILKKDYNGWEATSHYGVSPNDGHYTERSFSLVGGTSNGTTSLTASAEYTSSDPIMESQRPYTNPYYATTFVPGIVEIFSLAPGSTYDEAFQLAPGHNAPPGGGTYTMAQLVALGYYNDLGSFNDPGVVSEVQRILNLAAKQTLVQSMKRSSATVDFEHKIYADKLVAFGDMLYSHTVTQTSLNAQPLYPYISDPNSDLGYTGTTPPASGQQLVPLSAPTNPFTQASLDQGFSNGGGGYTVLVHDRFVDDPRLFQNDSTSFRGVIGLKGQIGADWSWETAVDVSRYQLNFTNPGLLDANNLIAAFQTGTVNPFAITQAPGALNGIVGTAFLNATSTLNSWDGVIRGAVLDLPGGKLKFALGAAFDRQNVTAIPDSNSANDLWVDSPTVIPFNRNRTISSVYGELEIPVFGEANARPGLHALAFDVAERDDDYSAVGNSNVPKVDVKYQPLDDELSLRGSVGKSFIAPPLYALFGPTTQGTSNQVTYTGANGNVYNQVQFQAVSGADPNLKPSTSNNWTAGFVYAPRAAKGLTLTFDFFESTEKGVVSSIDEGTVIQSVEDLGASSPYAGDIRFGSPTGPGPSGNTPGQISSRPLSDVFIVTPLINLGAIATKGFDAAANYELLTPSAGKFTLSASLTVYNSLLIQVLPTENYYQYAGHIANIEAAIPNVGGTVPRWRTYVTLDWDLGAIEAFVAHTFVPTVTDIGSGGINESPPLPVASYSQFDAGLGLDFSKIKATHWLGRLSLRLGVDNAFNAMPPVAPYQLEETKADIGTYDGAIGRLVFVDAKYKF